ncbi:MATE family efflux transporter [Kitasatospora purpeofusca]|uniref:MATE family efflux transporter n=1 Tax=Kitasatospora purpeofusca TaxID=67352 RepID=UPI002252EA5D|nr:MATE family efflux transporter [Kitasatospora purpeofusca]MCX4683527.1 MATE family efflux transporter [Kitasatospora purpeofusca]
MRGHLPRLVALAGPVYGELLSGVVASVVGAYWVAGLGAPAVAAVTLTGTVENLLLGLVLVVASGTTVRLAHAHGAGDRAGAGRVARAAWRLCALGSLLIAVPGFLARDRIAAAFLDGEAAALAADWFTVTFPAFALFFAQRIADELFKGVGDTRTPLRTALLGNALLLVLDPLLILGPGPFPALGVTGAALALTASRAVALAVTALLRRRHRLPAPVGGLLSEGLLAEGRAITATGAPFGLDFTARMGVGTVQLGLVAAFGVPAVAGYGVGYRVLLIVTMAFYAVRQAAAIEAARLTGAARRAGVDPAAAVRSLARDTARLAGVLGAGAALLCVAAARPVTALFTDDPAVAGEAVGFLRMAGLYLLPYALVVALGGVHQAAGAGRRPVVAVLVGLTAQLASGVVLSGPFGVRGLWVGMTIGALVQLALLLLPLSRRRVGGTGEAARDVPGRNGPDEASEIRLSGRNASA